MTQQELFEADKCFVWVLDKIRVDKIPFRSVLFGSTLERWFNDKMLIVTTTFTTEPNYEYIGQENSNGCKILCD